MAINNMMDEATTQVAERITERFRGILEAVIDPCAPIEIVVYYDPKTRKFQIRPTQYHAETIDAGRAYVVK
jgi:hypothetical protein